MLESLRLPVVVVAGLLLVGAATPASAGKVGSSVAPGQPARFETTRIFIEYNSTDNDLGFHVALDAEDWRAVKIVNPLGKVIFDVQGGGPYARLGLSELFVEGAEPTLDDFPLDRLLALFPEGRYRFIGVTASGEALAGDARLSHAVPAGPAVSSEVHPGLVVIRWEEVTAPPDGFPDKKIDIVGYQVIVDPFQVTLPATARQVTLPEEFVSSLSSGPHGFEVLAIDKSGNQTITAGSFEIP